MQARCCLVTLAAVTSLCLSPCTPAQRQFEERLVKRYLPLDRDTTRDLAAGDVDGDGDMDLVHGNLRRALYLNDGRGIFADVTAARMPGFCGDTGSVALGDVDGDGDLDLVVANPGGYYGGEPNCLFLNDGTGTFSDATQGRLPAARERTLVVMLGDLDLDGDLDLVCGNRYQQNSLLLNDGTGIFTDVTAARMPVDFDTTFAVAMGDVDGDGDVDLVLGNWLVAGGQNRLYLNDGTATFIDATATRMPVLLDRTTAVVLCDVDADGDLDLVIANSPAQNHLYLNDGTGTFANATAARMPAESHWTAAVSQGDVDGDGDPDLVLANSGFGEQNTLYLNDGTGIFTDATAARMPADADVTFSLVLSDVDMDGDLDLGVGNGGLANGQNRLYLNDGTGVFTNAAATRIPLDDDYTKAVAVGDVDGDGDLDLVIGNDRAQNRLQLNDGTGTFTDGTAMRMPPDAADTEALALGDVDGDADLDLVIGNDSGQQNYLYLNDGAGFFTDATAARMPADFDRSNALAMGDVDGDGDVDLVIGNGGFLQGGQNRLYLNDGTGTFADATTMRMPIDLDCTESVVLGDLDGDGDLDLVLGNGRSQQNRLYLNDGTGTFDDATATRMPVDRDRTSSVALGDLDGDGDLDLVIGNDVARQNRLYLNDGTGSFTDATAARMPVDGEFTKAVLLAAVDGDRDLDLVIGNRGGQTRLYVNNGRGTFTDVSVARMPTDSDGTWAVALGDLDGDSDPEIILGNERQDAIYTNLHRQLSTPAFPTVSRGYDIEFQAKPGYGSTTHTGTAVLSTALAPAPISIPPLGTLFLNPPLFALPSVRVSGLTSVGVLRLPIPTSPSLIGIVIYVQGAIVDTMHPSDVLLTGYTADAIRR